MDPSDAPIPSPPADPQDGLRRARALMAEVRWLQDRCREEYRTFHRNLARHAECWDRAVQLAQWTCDIQAAAVHAGRPACTAATGRGDPGGHDSSGLVVVIGCSAGGLSALYTILDALPADYGGAIVIAVHDSRPGLGLLPMLLRGRSPLPVGLARHGLRPPRGRVLLAPGGHHLTFDPLGYFVLTDAGPSRPGRGYCPSIDRLFRSLAAAYGPRAVAVVLSGMADDGALACRQVLAHGGLVIAQDEGSARYAEMPAATIDLARPDLILTPGQIGFALECLGRDPAAPAHRIPS